MLSSSDYDIAEAIRFFNKYSVEATYLVPTQVGLEKSILDATSPFRSYLREKGIHEYEGQEQGPDGRRFVKAFFVDETRLIPTKASLYRPKAKGKDGDPRVCFYDLRSYANPNNLLAIIAHEDQLFVINVSRSDLIKTATDSRSPLHRLLVSVGSATSDIADELLDRLREIAKRGWIPTVTVGDTGIGATLEHCLGIVRNSKKTPDYKGIELKTKRVSRFRQPTRSTLFAQVPDWDKSFLKSSAEILDTYGYMRNGLKRLNCTVRADIPNSQGLMFRIMEARDQLHECAKIGEALNDVAVWDFDLLRRRLLHKHNETFWIAGSASRIDGLEHFQYHKVRHTRHPYASNFHTLCHEGIITMDHLIKREDGKVKERGPLFKIKPENLSLLFPPSLDYELL